MWQTNVQCTLKRNGKGLTLYTLKTGTPVENGGPILNFLLGVSCPEIQLGVVFFHTPKTGTPIEDGDSILKLLQRVSCPEIQ